MDISVAFLLSTLQIYSLSIASDGETWLMRPIGLHRYNSLSSAPAVLRRSNAHLHKIAISPRHSTANSLPVGCLLTLVHRHMRTALGRKVDILAAPEAQVLSLADQVLACLPTLMDLRQVGIRQVLVRASTNHRAHSRLLYQLGRPANKIKIKTRLSRRRVQRVLFQADRMLTMP